MMDAQTQKKPTDLEELLAEAKRLRDKFGSAQIGLTIESFEELLQLVREQENEITRLSIENDNLSEEIRHLKSELCIDDELDDAGIECSYCNELVDKVHGSPFLADAGAVMCRDCWNMTREEYIGSEGTDIGPFDDEDTQEEST